LKPKSILSVLFIVFLALPIFPFFLDVESVEAQTSPTNPEPSIIATITGPPIIFEETSDYVKLNFTMFVVEFYKGTAGYNKIYAKNGSVLVYDDRIVLEYWTGKQWKQRGTPVDISWKKFSDYHYEVTRFYDDYAGTTYNVTYTVKSDSPMKITISLKSGQTDEYRIAWYPSGIVHTKWRKHGNRMVFGDEAEPYGWIGFEWNDVYQSFGDVTEASCEDVANGKKAKIYFNIGVVEAGQTVTIDPSTVGTSTSGLATVGAYQRKVVYANGLWWVFYSNGSDILYQTSQDGVAWSDVKIARPGDNSDYSGTINGWTFTIWVDGSTFIYAFLPYNDTNIYPVARKGEFLADGSISWSQTEQQIITEEYNYFREISICKDSSDYYWVFFGSDGTNSYIHWEKSNTTDPLWDNSLSRWDETKYVVPLVLPLTNNKVYVIYARNDGILRGRLYDGASWGTIVQVGTIPTQNYFQGFSAVSSEDIIHLVYLDNNTNIIYKQYTAGSWSSGVAIASNVSSTSHPVISRNPDTGDLIVFWAENNHIYYKKYDNSSGQWDASPVDWIDESIEGLTGNNRLTCAYQAFNNYIGLVYMTGTSSPYKIKFALWMPNQSPNAPALDSPSTDAAFEPSEDVTFSWLFNDPDAGDSQSSYQFQLDDQSDFSSPIIDTGKVVSGASSITQTLPSSFGIYYWRVKTWDSQDAEGAWSEARSIKIVLKHVSGYEVEVPSSWITTRLDNVKVYITNQDSYDYVNLYVDVVWLKEDGSVMKYENFTFPDVPAGESVASELTVTPPSYDGTYTVQVIGWYKGSRYDLFTYELAVTVSPGSGSSAPSGTGAMPTLPLSEEEETPPPATIIKPPIPWEVPLGIAGVSVAFYFFAATRKPSHRELYRKKRKKPKPEDFRRRE